MLPPRTPRSLSIFTQVFSLPCLRSSYSLLPGKKCKMTLLQPPQINATWPEKCLQPGVTRCNLEHNHRLTGPLRAGRQDPVLPEELLAEHVSALKEWARIPVAVRTQVCVCVWRVRAQVWYHSWLLKKSTWRFLQNWKHSRADGSRCCGWLGSRFLCVSA